MSRRRRPIFASSCVGIYALSDAGTETFDPDDVRRGHWAVKDGGNATNVIPRLDRLDLVAEGYMGEIEDSDLEMCDGSSPVLLTRCTASSPLGGSVEQIDLLSATSVWHRAPNACIEWIFVLSPYDLIKVIGSREIWKHGGAFLKYGDIAISCSGQIVGRRQAKYTGSDDEN